MMVRYSTLLLFGQAILLTACVLDIVENEYTDYDSALSQGFNGNGYLPIGFFKKSSINIKTLLHIDSQEALMKYEVSDSTEFSELMNTVSSCMLHVPQPRTLNIPAWWDIENSEISYYCYRDRHQRSFHFAIDTDKQAIFTWYLLSN